MWFLPALFATLGGLVTTLVTTIVEAVGKKTVVAGVIVAGVFSCYALFVSLLRTQIETINNSIPTGESWLIIGITLLPSNTDECIAAIAASHVCVVTMKAVLTAAGIRAAA